MVAEKILDKVQKLKRAADGEAALGNEAAAEAFAAAFQRMLTEHKLEMSDLEFEQFEAEQPVSEHRIDYTRYPELKVRRARIAWMEQLAAVIAGAHYCRILVYPGSSRITLVGRKDDCEVAEYMLVTLQRAAERLADAAYAKFTLECVTQCATCGVYKVDHHGLNMCRDFEPNWAKARGFRPSFLTTFIWRLSQRYREERQKYASQQTALVRLNTAEQAVTNFMARKVAGENGRQKRAYGRSGALSPQTTSNRAGVERGRAAADSVDLRANSLKSGNRTTRGALS